MALGRRPRAEAVASAGPMATALMQGSWSALSAAAVGLMLASSVGLGNLLNCALSSIPTGVRSVQAARGVILRRGHTALPAPLFGDLWPTSGPANLG